MPAGFALDSDKARKQANMNVRLKWIAAVVMAAIAAGGYWNWKSKQTATLPTAFASGNGRIEAVDIDISTKAAGRINDILVDEGDMVKAGQTVAIMQSDTLNAALREAEAQLRRSESARATAQAVVRQRESMRGSNAALIEQRKSELALTEREFKRSEDLVAKGFISAQKLDVDRARRDGARSALAAAESQSLEVESAIMSSKAQVTEAESTIEAARAAVQRVRIENDDTALKAPRDGRVQHRVAQPGEVIAGGGKVLTLIDLSEVYMNFFLPETVAGGLAIGSEVRIVLDAAPQYVFPAKVSFVSAEAQFTPKTVETTSERQKLVFRVKARVAPDLLERYMDRVKTGLPGVATVRLTDSVDWPVNLQVQLPQ